MTERDVMDEIAPSLLCKTAHLVRLPRQGVGPLQRSRGDACGNDRGRNGGVIGRENDALFAARNDDQGRKGESKEFVCSERPRRITSVAARHMVAGKETKMSFLIVVLTRGWCRGNHSTAT